MGAQQCVQVEPRAGSGGCAGGPSDGTTICCVGHSVHIYMLQYMHRHQQAHSTAQHWALLIPCCMQDSM